MTDSFRDDLQKVLDCDLRFADEVPPRLAHYTSIATLEKIVASREMWLSSALYMNDSQELLDGMDTGALEFRSNSNMAAACGSPTNHANLIKAFDERLQQFDSGHALDTYVLCFSEHPPDEDEDGRLSMWRGYGDRGSGVALVFDTEKLTPSMNAPLVLGKVSYVGDPEKLAWCSSKVSDLAEVLRKHPGTQENFDTLVELWIERLQVYSLFTKHDGFEEEAEWRIVYFSERDKARTYASRFSYAITSRGVEPKLKLKIESPPSICGVGLPFDQVLKRIILGPAHQTIRDMNSVRRMLDLSGCPTDVEVCPSSIPFRP